MSYTIVEASEDSPYGYHPYGGASELFVCKSREIILHGPAGTGKTRACLEKLDICAWKYDGMRAAIVRKTRRSMTASVLVTYGTKVLLPQTPVRFSTSRQEYIYPNGSTLTLSGMDKASKILSAEFDLIYVAQAEELSEDDWETLLTRLRFGRIPYQQLIADCNPDAPTHWLKERMDSGKAVELVSRHEDNPLLFDHESKEWTEQGESYVLGTLESLTGVRYWRLRHGRWVAAEGAVYENFDRSVHMIYQDEMPPMRKYIAGVDWGFTNAGVLQVWGMDWDGRLYRIEEYYHTGKLIDWWASVAIEMHSKYSVEAFVCDPSGAAYIQQFVNSGLPAIGGFNNIGIGIQAISKRMQIAGDGKPRLYLCYDAIQERDEALVIAKQPWSTEQEVDLYSWPKTSLGARNQSETPVDRHNHGLDAARYVVAYCDNLENKEPEDESWFWSA